MREAREEGEFWMGGKYLRERGQERKEETKWERQGAMKRGYGNLLR